jgi:hypothetical protein
MQMVTSAAVRAAVKFYLAPRPAGVGEVEQIGRPNASIRAGIAHELPRRGPDRLSCESLDLMLLGGQVAAVFRACRRGVLLRPGVVELFECCYAAILAEGLALHAAKGPCARAKARQYDLA